MAASLTRVVGKGQGKPAPTAVAIAHPMGEMPNIPSCLYPRGFQTCFAWSTEVSRLIKLSRSLDFLQASASQGIRPFLAFRLRIAAQFRGIAGWPQVYDVAVGKRDA